MAGSADRQRVVLHVGLPKTGTTFLQAVLWEHRDRLREQGVLFPGAEYDDHFLAAVDLQDLPFHDAPRPEATGHWERLAAAARDWPGTTVLSHDVLASATVEQAARAVADLAPAEVHVVVTARDLARQLPSHWQEDVKNGSTESLAEWYAAVARHDPGRWSWRWFWESEDLPAVLARWGAAVPVERVHVVTVPPPGAPRTELWARFCTAAGLDPALIDPAETEVGNTGLAAAEVELLRRLNAELSGAMTQQEHERVVKGVLVHETLVARDVGSRVAPPVGSAEATTEQARAWVDAVRASGVDVVGDLDDLLPAPAGPAGSEPPSESPSEPPTDAEVAAAASWALARLLVRLRDERRDHAAEVAGLADLAERRQAELDDLHARLRRIDQHPLVRLRHRLRRLVGRGS